MEAHFRFAGQKQTIVYAIIYVKGVEINESS